MSDPIARAFAQFHAENPTVYERLRSMALGLRRVGHARYGIAGLFEVLRYETSLLTFGRDGLKLNNNYAALYARMLEQREPTLEGFFAMRVRKARFVDGQIIRPGDQPSPSVDRHDERIGA